VERAAVVDANKPAQGGRLLAFVLPRLPSQPASCARKNVSTPVRQEPALPGNERGADQHQKKVRPTRIIIALIWLLAASGAHAREFFHYNGSAVEVETDGQQMRIIYIRPAPGLPPAVGPGTLIFEGGISERSKQLEGYAYVYDRCGRQQFWVSGSETDNGRVVELVGLIQLKNQRCKSVFIDRTTLKFTHD
jgi:hypothetical protein